MPLFHLGPAGDAFAGAFRRHRRRHPRRRTSADSLATQSSSVPPHQRRSRAGCHPLPQRPAVLAHLPPPGRTHLNHRDRITDHRRRRLRPDARSSAAHIRPNRINRARPRSQSPHPPRRHPAVDRRSPPQHRPPRAASASEPGTGGMASPEIFQLARTHRPRRRFPPDAPRWSSLIHSRKSSSATHRNSPQKPRSHKPNDHILSTSSRLAATPAERVYRSPHQLHTLSPCAANARTRRDGK